MRSQARSRPHLAVLAASVAFVGLIAGCSGSSDDPAPTSAPTSESTTTEAPSTTVAAASLPVGEPSDVTTGLDAPWSVAFVGQSALISERDSGRVLELLGDGTTRTVGTVDGVVHRAEDGLLGIAVDDDQRLYACLLYTSPSPRDS